MTTLIIEKTAQNPSLVTAVKSAASLKTFSNPDLLRIYNGCTGRATKKFATRDKALSQTYAVVKEFAAVDLRAEPPVVYRRGDALPEGFTTAPGSAQPDVRRSQPVVPAASEEVTEQVIPASRPVGRPPAGPPVWRSRKLKDGTYEFNMPARAQKAAPGGRRPELIAQLRKSPTFKQLQQRFSVHGDTPEQQAFNLATAITCMGHVTGYGVVTGEKGRLQLLEPLS